MRQNWWVFALRGVAGVLFGIGAFVWPGLTLVLLTTLFGAFALFNGVLEIVTAVRRRKEAERWLALLLSGIVGVVLGLFAWFAPAFTALSLVYLIAGWAIVTGILGVAAAITLRKELRNEWMWVVGSVLSIATGVILAAAPGAGALALIWLIGSYSIVFGGALIAFGLRIRSFGAAPTPRASFRPSVPSTA